MRIINADGWLSEEATMLHPPRARLVFFSPVLHPINSAVTLPYRPRINLDWIIDASSGGWCEAIPSRNDGGRFLAQKFPPQFCGWL